MLGRFYLRENPEFCAEVTAAAAGNKLIKKKLKLPKEFLRETWKHTQAQLTLAQMR
jgi:hypothetical protein